MEEGRREEERGEEDDGGREQSNSKKPTLLHMSAQRSLSIARCHFETPPAIL